LKSEKMLLDAVKHTKSSAEFLSALLKTLNKNKNHTETSGRFVVFRILKTLNKNHRETSGRGDDSLL